MPNPLDLFLDLVLALASFTPKWLAWPTVLARCVAELGFTEEQAEESLGNWESLEVLQLSTPANCPHTVLHIRVVQFMQSVHDDPALIDLREVDATSREEGIAREILSPDEDPIEGFELSPPPPGEVIAGGAFVPRTPLVPVPAQVPPTQVPVLAREPVPAQAAVPVQVAAAPKRPKYGSCPRCNRALHLGVNGSGQPFLSCNGYKTKPEPKCRYITSCPPDVELPNYWVKRVRVDF